MDLIPFGGPHIDIKETDKEVIVQAQIPGIDPKKIKFEISENSIKLSGEAHVEKEVKDKNFYRKESMSHSFNRVITLPCPVQQDGVKTVSKNWALVITLLKKHSGAPHQMKKIPIEEE